MKLATRGNQRAGRGHPEYMPETSRQVEARVKTAQARAKQVTDDQRVRAFASSVLDGHGGINMEGWRKVGQAFVGPILIRLRYEGVVRDLLLERPLPQGVAPIFPVKKDIGIAYTVQGNMGEIRMHRVEATRVNVPLFRVGSRPMVSKQDVLGMDFDLISSVKDDAFNMIREEEDRKYFGLLNKSITDFESRTGISHTINNVGGWVPQAFHTAAKKVADLRLKASRIILSAGEYYDFFDWGLEQLGISAREEITATGTFPRYGDMVIKPTIACPNGVAYVQPDPGYVGFMPIQWSLDATPDDIPSAALLGFVYDESIGMTIVNANGLIKIVKV